MEAMRFLLFCLYCLPRTISQSQEDKPSSSLKMQDSQRHLSKQANNQSPVRLDPINVDLHFRRQNQEAPNEEENDKYDPNRGFEPYWPGGEWVFVHRTTPGTTVRTTTQPKICGTSCNHLLRKLGKVCGHRQNEADVREWNCPNERCDGYYFDNLYRFSTFTDYCEFMSYQCNTIAHEKWLFVHMGQCEWYELYKPLQGAYQPVSRANAWLNAVSRAIAKYSSRTVRWG